METPKPKHAPGPLDAVLDEFLACYRRELVECDRLKAVNAELLEALERLLAYHWHNVVGVKPKEYHAARAAIAKATE